MKGLMFNLLESLARDAGCSEEAWELVAEFAAADLLSDGAESGAERLWGSDVQPLGAFEVPTEAMLTCLTRDSRGDCSLDLKATAKPPAIVGSEWLQESMPDFAGAEPSESLGGFGPNAFCGANRGCELGLLCTQLEADEDEDDWDEELAGLPFLRDEPHEH